MKYILPPLIAVFLLTGCKKAIEEKKENVIVAAMTSGQWKVSSYTSGGTDFTSGFEGYSFQYYADRTVEAINTGGRTSGTWNENADKMEIVAFFSSTSLPLPLLNGTWHIDQSDWVHVWASKKEGATTSHMELQKL